MADEEAREAAFPHTSDDHCPRCFGVCGSNTPFDEDEARETAMFVAQVTMRTTEQMAAFILIRQARQAIQRLEDDARCDRRTGGGRPVTADEARAAAREFAADKGLTFTPEEWTHIDASLTDHEARMSGEGTAVATG